MDLDTTIERDFQNVFNNELGNRDTGKISQIPLRDMDDVNDEPPFWSPFDNPNDFVHLSIPDNLNSAKKLELWFSYLKSTTVDIISQLGGSSAVFYVHVESLILKFSLDPLLRFDYKVAPQCLQLVFFVENFLSSLRQCGGTFRLVFLDCFRSLLAEISPFLLAVRDAFYVSCLLSENLGPDDFIAFPCFEDPKFISFIIRSQPPFVLVDDCTALWDVLGHDKFSEGLRCLPYLFIYKLLEAEVHVALLFDIRSKGRKIHAYCINPPITPLGSLTISSLLKDFSFPNMSTSPFTLNDLKKTLALCDVNALARCGIRDVLIVTFLRTSLENCVPDSCEKEFYYFIGQMLLLSSQLCRFLPLKYRALSGFDFESDDMSFFTAFKQQATRIINEFLTGVSHTLQIVLESSRKKHFCEEDIVKTSGEHCFFHMISDYWSSSECMKDFLDFIDCRLVYILIVLVIKRYKREKTRILDNSFFSLPREILTNLNFLFRLIRPDLEGDGIQLDLTCLSYLSDDCVSVQPRVVKESDQCLPNLQFLQSDFLNLLLETQGIQLSEGGLLRNTVLDPKESDFGVSFWKSPLGEHFTPGLLMDIAELQIERRLTIDNLTSFVNQKLLEGLHGAQKTKMIQKQRLRIAQRGASTVHKFGASLGTPSRYHHSIKVSVRGQHVWSNIFDSAMEEANDTTRSAGKKKEQGDSKKKMSSKALSIIKKNEDVLHQKIIRTDNERLPSLLSKINALAYKRLSPSGLCNRILDILVGTLRYTQELTQFPALNGFLSLPESKCQVLMAIVDILIISLYHYDSQEPTEKLNEYQAELHELLCFSFHLLEQIFHSFQDVLNVENIIKMQKLFIILGFNNSAKALYTSWKGFMDKRSKSLSGEAGHQAKITQEKYAKKVTLDSKSLKRTAKISDEVEIAFVDPKSVQRLVHAIPSQLENEVQMQFMGHEMTRSLGSAFDPRVKFQPDKWQIRLLDIIDEYRSTLVCAPTGCGKTFACYYAMEKVLTYDNEGVCVFVCPSKALVQQVEHEVKARFSTKEYPSGCRMGLIGTLLTHIEDKPLKCQILLTLPSMFEILLMSPNYREWVGRLRYVILDEIHCIGEGDEEGRAWERLIQLIPCPFIALSATVGNPLSFHHWLSHAHQSHEKASSLDKAKRNVEIITFDERYADLNYYIFTTKNLEQNSNSFEASPSLLPLNPFVCLPYEQILNQGIIKNFYLPSADFLKAYFVVRDLLCAYYGIQQDGTSAQENFLQLSAIERAEVLTFVTEMHPSTYFCNIICISKRQYRYYLGWFMESFSYMIRQGIISHKLYSTMVCNLVESEPIHKSGDLTKGTLWAPCRKNISSQVLEEVSSWSKLKEKEQEAVPLMNSIYSFKSVSKKQEESFRGAETLLEFCRTLQRLGFLPVLSFNFNRTIVTHLFQSLSSLLVNLQHQKYYGTPEAAAATRAANKKRMDEYKALVRHREMLEKLKSVSKRQREEEDIDIDEADALPLEPPPIDIAEEYDEEFSFVNRRVWGTHYDEIEEIIEGVTNRLRKKDLFYIEALRRGIGFHHSGLGRRYRAAVEMLFRMGFLRIVFSTETLSLGVNMPCKATVFLGDSLMLTSLLFRQTAGRAGRRGFDVLGHVIFWDVPFSKLKRLICAHLPVLSGEFNVTVTDVLRTYQLINTVEAQHMSILKVKRKNCSAVQLKKIESSFELQLQNLQKSLLRMYHTPLFMVRTTSAQESLQDLHRIRNAIKYAFRFAANHARMCNLLSGKADPVGLAGLCILLYNEEPGSLALAASFLSGGILDYLDAPVTPEEILPTDKSIGDHQFPLWKLRRFITLFSQFVVPLRLNYNVYLRMKLDPNFDPLLPCANPFIIQAIEEYNSIAFTNAKNYVRCSSTTMLDWEKEYSLPITRAHFNSGEKPFKSYKEIFTGLFQGQLCNQLIVNSTRSPFTAIGGRSNSDFFSTYELQQSKPQDILFSDSLVSYYSPYTVVYNGQCRYLLSNYALHFFSYKSQRRTAESSCVNANDLWDYLTRFEGCLWTLKAYLNETLRVKSCREQNKPQDNLGYRFLKLVEEVFSVFEHVRKAEAAI